MFSVMDMRVILDTLWVMKPFECIPVLDERSCWWRWLVTPGYPCQFLVVASMLVSVCVFSQLSCHHNNHGIACGKFEFPGKEDSLSLFISLSVSIVMLLWHVCCHTTTMSSRKEKWLPLFGRAWRHSDKHDNNEIIQENMMMPFLCVNKIKTKHYTTLFGWS